MIEDHPIFGVGLDNYRIAAQTYVDSTNIPVGETGIRVAHNSYLEIAAEMGLPALFIFLGILVSSFRTLGQVYRAAMKLRGRISPASSFGNASRHSGRSSGIVFCLR